MLYLIVIRNKKIPAKKGKKGKNNLENRKYNIYWNKSIKKNNNVMI